MIVVLGFVFVLVFVTVFRNVALPGTVVVLVLAVVLGVFTLCFKFLGVVVEF